MRLIAEKLTIELIGHTRKLRDRGYAAVGENVHVGLHACSLVKVFQTLFKLAGVAHPSRHRHRYTSLSQSPRPQEAARAPP